MKLHKDKSQVHKTRCMMDTSVASRHWLDVTVYYHFVEDCYLTAMVTMWGETLQHVIILCV